MQAPEARQNDEASVLVVSARGGYIEAIASGVSQCFNNVHISAVNSLDDATLALSIRPVCLLIVDVAALGEHPERAVRRFCEKNRGTVFIAFSNCDISPVEAKLFAAGVNEIISGPPSSESIKRAVHRSWAQRKYRESVENELRAHSMRELRRLNEFLEALVDNLPLMCFVKDAKTLDVTFWNKMSQQVTGIHNAQILGTSGEQLFPADAYDAYKQMDRLVLETGKLITYQEVIDTPNGRLRLMTTKSPLVGPEGVPTHLLGISEDVTTRYELEERLRLWHSAFRSVTNGVVICDPDRKGFPIIDCNPAFESLTGYSREEVLGRSCRFLQGEDRDQPAVARIRHAIEERSPCRVMLRNYRRDGSMFWNELTVAPVFAPDNSVTHFVGIQNDVTARVERERLTHEQTALRDAVATLEKILGIVGHELRTPLASLRVMTELLQLPDTGSTVDRPALLKSLTGEIIRMSAIVNDLLETARMSSGTTKWQWGPVDLRKVMNDATGSIRYLINEPVTLHLNLPDDDIAFMGDQNSLVRLVVNLISNAAKYTKAGAIRISSCRDLLEGRDFVLLRVSDQGEGIDPQLAESLGRPFALNSGVVGTNYVKGSGLGLSICKGIVEAHGGTLHIASAKGRGTTVTAYIATDLTGPAEAVEGTRTVVVDIENDSPSES